MKKRVLPIILSTILLISLCTGCSVFSDLADQVMGTTDTPEPIIISSYYDPAQAEAEAEAAEKAARESLSAEQLSSTLAPAIVKITTFDAAGNQLSVGTGFFASGGVFTTFENIAGASSATITVYDTGLYEVTGIHFYDQAMNVAVLACPKQNAPDLQPGKWGVEADEAAFALAPDGVVTSGTVMMAVQNINGFDCVQTSASINETTAGGPLVNQYGELLGLCLPDLLGDGQNYAFGTNAMATLDLSQTISFAEMCAATGASVTTGTRVLTGDDGQKVYTLTSAIELENNDSPDQATALVKDQWTAAFVNYEGSSASINIGEEEDPDGTLSDPSLLEDYVDVFSFTVEQAGTVDLYLWPYYENDVSSLDGTWVKNAEQDHMTDESGNSAGYFSSSEKDGETCQHAQCYAEPGTYYVVVKLLDSWNADNGGCYYKISYSVG